MQEARTSDYEVVLKLFGVDEQVTELYDRLSRALATRSSTSVLLLGRRGSGKTATLEHVLRRLRAARAAAAAADEHAARDDGMQVVRLNGLVHAESAAALREIATQLSIDGVPEIVVVVVDLGHAVD